jgi:hypothetical protein
MTPFTGARAFQASAVFRTIALAIAVAGVIDPACTLSGASRARVAVVALRSAPPAAEGIRERLVHDLSASYEVVPYVTSDAAAAIVIGDRIPDDPLPEAMLVATVTTPEAVRPGVRIVRIDAPHELPSATMIRLDVDVEGSGLSGQTTDLTATIAGLEISRASHRWAADEERWHAGLDVVPVGEPPYAIQVRLEPDTTGTLPGGPFASVASGFSRTVADVVVHVRRAPFRVEFYDPRPSWATTFVRRALEADRRFQVATVSFTSRGISAQSGSAVPLADPRLDAFAVVIVGGLDRLSAADGRSLDRFMRERAGAVVLVPDQRIAAGPAADLVSGIFGSVRLQPDLTERLLEHAATLTIAPPVASLQASELLVLRALPPGADAIARVPGSDASPVIASAPRGDGRLLLSGAMDAWRFRAADNGAFDRFWQSTIAGLALNVPAPITIGVVPDVLRPGERAEVIVRVRSRDVTGVSATLDGAQPIRLLPDPESGVYRGRFAAKDTAGRSTIEVRTAAAQPSSASATVLVRADAQRVRPAVAPALAMLSSSHRGIDATPEHVTDVERFLRRAVAVPRAPVVRHPMRSTWWILPLVACLSAEWWRRRRQGLR